LYIKQPKKTMAQSTTFSTLMVASVLSRAAGDPLSNGRSDDGKRNMKRRRDADKRADNMLIGTTFALSVMYSVATAGVSSGDKKTLSCDDADVPDLDGFYEAHETNDDGSFGSFHSAGEKWIWHSVPPPPAGPPPAEIEVTDNKENVPCCSATPSTFKADKKIETNTSIDITEDCSTSLEDEDDMFCDDDSEYWIGEDEWFQSSASIEDSDISLSDGEEAFDSDDESICSLSDESTCYDVEEEVVAPTKAVPANNPLLSMLHQDFKLQKHDCHVPAMKPCDSDYTMSTNASSAVLGLGQTTNAASAQFPSNIALWRGKEIKKGIPKNSTTSSSSRANASWAIIE